MRRRPPRSTRSVTLLPYPTLFRSYDPDHVLARGEVGKVGVPVAHLGHMGELLDGIPQGEMNTSMTINAPAAWMLGLYVANRSEEHKSELQSLMRNSYAVFCLQKKNTTNRRISSNTSVQTVNI